VSRTARLVTVLLLNLLLVTALVAVGVTAHSLGVLAAGADYLADAAAIAVSLLAIWLSRRPVTGDRPDGYPMATTIAALVNAGWLMVLCLAVIVGAVARLVGGAPEVHGLPVLVVSAIAALVMIAGVVILGGDADGPADDAGGDLNMRAVLLDTAADAAAATGVAITGGIILATHGYFWLDPAVALVIALVIGYHAGTLLRAVATVLRRPLPPGA
jgi:cobalt-zinc-cadmium efflux system protein